jgi:AbrB family looped-hinge helix DNA binding protein
MTYVTVSSKGQITLPIRARRALGIRPRDRVVVNVDRHQIVLRAAPGILSLAGSLGSAASSVDERSAAMAHVADRQAGSGR